jgi:hypothetical protein
MQIRESEVFPIVQRLISGASDLAKGLIASLSNLVVTGTANIKTLQLDSTTVTATAAQINKLATVTSSAAELNYVDVTAAGTAQASKAVVLDASKDIAGLNAVGAATLTTSGKATVASLKIGETDITATGTDINKLATVTATAAELNYTDVTTAGTAQASKAVVLDANKDVTGLNAVSAATLSLSGIFASAGIVLTIKTHAYSDATAWTLSADEEKATILTATGVSGGAADVVALPTAGKLLIVSNATGSALTIKATGQTGVAIADGKTAVVYGDGTDFVEIVSLA